MFACTDTEALRLVVILGAAPTDIFTSTESIMRGNPTHTSSEVEKVWEAYDRSSRRSSAATYRQPTLRPLPVSTPQPEPASPPPTSARTPTPRPPATTAGESQRSSTTISTNPYRQRQGPELGQPIQPAGEPSSPPPPVPTIPPVPPMPSFLPPGLPNRTLTRSVTSVTAPGRISGGR